MTAPPTAKSIWSVREVAELSGIPVVFTWTHGGLAPKEERGSRKQKRALGDPWIDCFVSSLIGRGQNVFLAASFNGWRDQIPMVRSG